MFQPSQPNHPAGFKSAWARLAILPLCTLAAQAWADGTWDDCLRNAGQVYQDFPPTAVQIGNNAAIGDVIGPWITASASPAWNCTRQSTHAGKTVQVSVQGYPPYPKLGTLSHDGQSYAYYEFGANMAYIARWRAVVDGIPTQWTPLTIATGGQQDAASTVSVIKADGEKYTIDVETQIRLVKRVATLPANYKLPAWDPMYVRHYQQVSGSATSYGSSTYRISRLWNGGGVVWDPIGVGGTCTTPDVPVKLPSVDANDFSDASPILGTTPFDLQFQNCPAGLYSISYYFTPTTTLLIPAQGVLALDNSSTAIGIGLQLIQDNGAALQFGQTNSYPLTAYDASTVSSYSVPLKASYYRTGNGPVGAGSVSTSVIFTLNYQ